MISFEEKFKDFQTTFDGVRIRQLHDYSILFNFGNKRDNSITYRYHPDKGMKEIRFLKKITLNTILVIKDKVWVPFKNKWILYDLNTEEKLKEFKIPNGLKNFSYVSGDQSNKSLFHGFNTKNEIILYELVNDKPKELVTISTDLNRKNNVKEKLYYHHPSGLVLVLLNKELIYYDLKKNTLASFQTFQNKEFKPFSKIALTDNQGKLWAIATEGAQLVQISDSRFKKLLSGYTQGRGIWVNKDFIIASKFIEYFDEPNKITTLPLDRALGVEANIRDELWKISLEGIINIHSDDGIIHPPISYSQELKNLKKTYTSWSILRDESGRWWTGMLGSRGLSISRKPHPDSLYIYEQYNDFKELKSSNIIHLIEDGDYIWAASNAGLYLIHKEKGVLHRYASDMPEEYQLPFDNVFYIHKDANDVFWAATNADGLVRFELDKDKKIKEYKKYTTKDGLSSNVLYAIIEDEKDNLWISSLYGISCFIKKTETVQTYFEVDGLPATEFNRASYGKGPDGRIYFGSNAGVISFHPDEIFKTTDKNAMLSITKFQKYERSKKEFVDYTDQLNQTQKIRYLPSDGAMSLSVSALNFFNSKKIRYAYKIEGRFDQFQFIDGNTIEISSLPYGRYKLIVRAQGTDGNFAENELSIPITVIRPFYATWWFFLVAFLLVLVTSFQFYQWRVRRLEERKRELELLVKERTLQIEKDKETIEKDKAIIEEQAVQLRELDELKSKFFANISHELRTPLTLILAPLNNLFNVNQLSNKQHTQLMIMRQNGNKLLKRINELLDLSRLDANKLEVAEEPTFLYPFFKTLLSTFESAANIKNVNLLFDFQLDENIQILTDSDKLEKIVSNFLSNALKFTPKDGSIVLRIEKLDKNLTISVKDTGIGIPAEDLSKVFDRFYQSKNDQQQQGTGIGLSLCQELAKVLKGRVWATSEVGKGSTFFVEMPLVETFALKEETTTEEAITEAILPLTITKEPLHKNIQKPTILVVEDNPDLRNYLTLILEENYQVIAVENGQEAIERLPVSSSQFSVDKIANNGQQVTGNPQLIISDIMMPVMDGIELLTQLKASDDFRHIPVIMLTARKSLEVKLEALRIGVDDYLTKPFTNEELIARVENLINNSQSRLLVEPPKDLKPQPKVSANDLQWIGEVEAIITDNLANSDFTILELARQLNISDAHARKKIKRITGLSPKQYERSIKLAKARKLLQSGEFSTVSEILYQLGFDNHYYFSKIYKKAYGIMPSDELKRI